MMLISDTITKQNCEKVLQNCCAISSLDNFTDLESHCIRGIVLYKPCHRKNEDYPQMSTVITLQCNASNPPLDTARNVIDVWFAEKWYNMLCARWKLRRGKVVALWGTGIAVVKNCCQRNHRLDHPYRLLCDTKTKGTNACVYVTHWESPLTSTRCLNELGFCKNSDDVVSSVALARSDSDFTRNEESVHIVKPCSRSKYSYVETYEELLVRRKKDKINIYGYIVSAGTPKPTRGDDLMMSLEILLPCVLAPKQDRHPRGEATATTRGASLYESDHQWTPAKRVTVKLFAPTIHHYTKLNIIRKGDIIRLHRVQVDIWEGIYELVGSLNPRKRGGFSATLVYANNECINLSDKASEIDYGIINGIRDHLYIQSMVDGPKIFRTLNILHQDSIVTNSRFILFDALHISTELGKPLKRKSIRGMNASKVKEILDQYPNAKLILLVQDGTGMPNHGFYSTAPLVNTPFNGVVCPLVVFDPHICQFILNKIDRLVRMIEVMYNCNNIISLGKKRWARCFGLEVLDMKRVDEGYFIFGPNSSIIFLNSEDDNVKCLEQKLLTGTEQDSNSTSGMVISKSCSREKQIEGSEASKANLVHMGPNSDTTTLLDSAGHGKSSNTFISNYGKRRKINVNNGSLSREKRKEFEFMFWGKNPGKSAILCTSTDQLNKISFSSVKAILNDSGSSSTANESVFKIRAEIVGLMALPENFTRQTKNGTYEYHFFMKVRDDVGTKLVVLVSGEEGSNFLFGIEPIDFSKNLKKLRQLERRILDIMYTDPQSLLDISVRRLAKESGCHTSAGDIFVLCDTSITIACDWWREI